MTSVVLLLATWGLAEADPSRDQRSDSTLVAAVLQAENPPEQPEPPEPPRLRPITGIEDIPPAAEPQSGHSWLYLIVILVIFFAAFWYRRRRVLPPPPPLPPDQWAKSELDRLVQANLPGSGESIRYHFLLSDIVRRYVEMRFDLRASRQTTPEFLATLQGVPQLSSDQKELLAGLLETCDLAKFAAVERGVQGCLELADRARMLIDQTTQSQAAPETNGTQDPPHSPGGRSS